MNKILWVDDDIYYRSSYVRELEDEGISVVIASDASEGKEVFNQFQSEIDGVIVDMMMPHGEEFDPIETDGGNLSGLAFSKFIKSEKPEMPLLGFTINENTEVTDWFRKHNCKLLRKQDIRPNELAALVKKELLGVNVIDLKTLIIHGHDDKTKLELKKYIQDILKIKEPIILHEQPSFGRATIDTFEVEAQDVDLVFVLLTPDDVGASASDSDIVKRRERKIVIFELGYFCAVLKRKNGKILLLHKGDLELPSDISGIVYIDITNGIEPAGEQIKHELNIVLNNP